jgi:hypothetical protein
VDTIQSWARAWQERNVEDFLVHYASDFMLPGGDSREGWARERLNGTEPLELEVLNVGTRSLGEARARARFHLVQRRGYREERSVVVLELTHSAAAWVISAEAIDFD